VPGVGGTFFHEEAIDESSSILSFTEADVGPGSAVEKSMNLFCECANLAAFKDYGYYKIGDPREQGDRRQRLRITFYKEPPPDLPVLVLSRDMEALAKRLSEPGLVAISTEDTKRFCDLLKGASAPQSVAKLSDVSTADFAKAPSSKEKLCSAAAKTDYPINELAMYGNIEKTLEQRQADERYIENMTVGGVSRDEASVMTAKVAWNTYYTGDCGRAMRLFNQAWLLDNDNQLALWGFAVIALERDQIDDAVRYFEMALRSGPRNPTLQADYEYVSQLK
jgi:hypothetical protein